MYSAARTLAGMILLALLTIATPAHGVTDPASAAIVVNGLNDAVSEMKSLVETAGAEVKGVALQLEVQIRELLAVIDKQLEGRINESFDRLDDSQKLLTRNAQQTLAVTLGAIDALRMKSTSDARELLREADMAAYNAAYSIPCRDKTPRVLYTSPKVIRVGAPQPAQVTIFGNFFRLSDEEPAIRLNGTRLKVDSLQDNEITVSLPATAFKTVRKAEAMSLSIEGLKRESTYNLWLACPSFRQDVSEPAKVQVLVRPEIVHKLDARLLGTVISERRTPAAATFRYAQTASSCTTNSDASVKYCLPPGDWTVGRADVNFENSRCGSYVRPAQVATGDRCALVPARLVSCGRNTAGLNCKGRGRLVYNVVLEAVERLKTPIRNMKLDQVTLVGSGASSAAWTFELPPGADPASIRYIVDITTTEGETKLAQFSLTSDLGVLATKAGYRAELDKLAGILTVQVPDTQVPDKE